MKAIPLIALIVALSSSAALSAKTLPSVEVGGDAQASLFIDCANPSKPNAKDVARVLSLLDEDQARALTPKLMAAAAEGCKAGIAKIVVTRNHDGRDLTWKAAP